MDRESIPTYVGRCTVCKGIVYAHVYDDDAKATRSKEIAREIAACVRHGYTVSLEAVRDVRSGIFCECIRAKRPRRVQQRSLPL